MHTKLQSKTSWSSQVPSPRDRLSRLLPVALMTLGGAVGFGLVLIYPPRHPDDRLFAVAVVGGGLAMLGLLAGMLVSLRLRGRINTPLALSAVAIPLASFAWFINAKGGQREIALVFACIGWAAVLAFVANAAALLSQARR